METTPTKLKKAKRYPPKLTACLCGKKGFIYRNGWICEMCNKIEDVNAKRVARTNTHTQSPLAKYADTFSLGRGIKSSGRPENRD